MNDTLQNESANMDIIIQKTIAGEISCYSKFAQMHGQYLSLHEFFWLVFGFKYGRESCSVYFCIGKAPT